MVRCRRTRTAAAAGATLVLVTACGGSGGDAAATVVDEASALDAVAASFAGSWSWTGQLEVALSDAQVAAVVDLQAGDEFGAPPDVAEAQLRVALDELARQRMHGALGDDHSFRTAWRRDDTDLIDVRLDVGEVLRADSMTPAASIVGAVDVPAILAWLRELDDAGMPVLGVFGESSIDDLRRQARMGLAGEPDLLAVVLAILDGGFGGPAGELDFADLGVGEDQLDDVREGFAEDLIGLADAVTFRRLAADAFTVRDIATEDGVTRAVLDLHPRRAAAAVDDLFDDARDAAQDLADDYLADDDLPDTLEEVAQLTFDPDGDLTEVRTDVLAVAGQLAGAMEVDGDDARLLSALQGATVQVVLTFADHDAVPTVADVDAVTMPWDGIADWFAPSVDDAMEP